MSKVRYTSKLGCDDAPKLKDETEILPDGDMATVVEELNDQCLVCLEMISVVSEVWNCENCYVQLHLSCLRDWMRESSRKICLSQQKATSDWSCPKCRKIYSHAPQYYCYCGKVTNPPHDHTRFTPHSCYGHCLKRLSDNCHHKCQRLCHPGKCGPCAVMVRTNCFCGNVSDVIKRCYETPFACEKMCEKELRCGEHLCEKTCHEGDCGNCEVRVNKLCECGEEWMNDVPCSQIVNCERICKKTKNCGIHECGGRCEHECTLICEKNRSCACGQTEYVNNKCMDRIPLCTKRCNNFLDCSIHQCQLICHYGDCKKCMVKVKKRCRCGKWEKLVDCSTKEYFCENRCNKLLDCGRHKCKEKCCLHENDELAVCRNRCNQYLSCNKHYCKELCHAGNCGLCEKRIPVKCSCGKTIISIPCTNDRKKNRQLALERINCPFPCERRVRCDHEKRITDQINLPGIHRCHPENVECESCQLICNKKYENCKHSCNSQCHSPIINQKLSLFQVKRTSCPPCTQLVTELCSKHLTPVEMSCSDSLSLRGLGANCQMVCQSLLSCSIHYCQRKCHNDGCGECRKKCSRKRQCIHLCQLNNCHRGDCPPCTTRVRTTCFCKRKKLNLICKDLSEDVRLFVESGRSSDLSEENDEIFRCRRTCLKLLECGHQCTRNCHKDDCNQLVGCKRDVVVTCPCGNLKEKIKCNDLSPETKMLFKRTKKEPITLQCSPFCKKVEEEKERIQLEKNEKIKVKKTMKKNETERMRFNEKMEENIPTEIDLKKKEENILKNSKRRKY
ncbi:hypothetical protein SNEBB_002079 [Seison nebaliae]|nr:hypothetical protein SNEBB_002079 [Seison nebaliae]